MRYIAFYLPILIVLTTSCKTSSSNQITNEQHTATLTLIVTESYCGGARPSPEMEEKLTTPHPFSNKSIYVIDPSGSSKLLQTNEHGQINLTGLVGSYRFFTKEKVETEIGFHDPDGCRAWKEKPNYSYTLSKQASASIVEFHITCNKCLPPAP